MIKYVPLDATINAFHEDHDEKVKILESAAAGGTTVALVNEMLMQADRSEKEMFVVGVHTSDMRQFVRGWLRTVEDWCSSFRLRRSAPYTLALDGRVINMVPIQKDSDIGQYKFDLFIADLRSHYISKYLMHEVKYRTRGQICVGRKYEPYKVYRTASPVMRVNGGWEIDQSIQVNHLPKNHYTDLLEQLPEEAKPRYFGANHD